jgi:hypothetical protein
MALSPLTHLPGRPVSTTLADVFARRLASRIDDGGTNHRRDSAARDDADDADDDYDDVRVYDDDGVRGTATTMTTIGAIMSRGPDRGGAREGGRGRVDADDADDGERASEENDGDIE